MFDSYASHRDLVVTVIAAFAIVASAIAAMSLL